LKSGCSYCMAGVFETKIAIASMFEKKGKTKKEKRMRKPQKKQPPTF